VEDVSERKAKLLRDAFADYRKFCGLVDIVPKGGKRQKLALNQIQRIYCDARTQRDVVLKPRQIGFTTEEQARDIFHFLTVPGARVVTTCQSMTDHTPSKLLASNYNVMLDGLRKMGVKLDVHATAGQWELPSRDARLTIIEAGASEAAAAKKGRAGTVTRLHLTETAFYEYAEQTLNALLECVPSVEYGTEIVSESTPNGAVGVFYSQCKEAQIGRSGFRFHFFPWFLQEEYRAALEPGEVIEPQTPRELELVSVHGITPEQLKWYRRKVSEKNGNQALVDQEYPSDVETCFLASGRLFFERTVTAALLAKAKPPILSKGDYRAWDEPRKGRGYLIAVDTAEGAIRTTPDRDMEAAKLGDYSVAIVYERGTGRHVATLRAHLPPWELARKLAELGRTWNGATVVVERNNHGHAVLQALAREQRYPKIYVGLDGKPGWLTTSASRPMALDLLEDAHRKGIWKTDDRQLLAELLAFIVLPNGRIEAARGEHDDMVMAAAIGWDVLLRPTAFRSFAVLPPA
jgi:hypothetical protein